MVFPGKAFATFEEQIVLIFIPSVPERRVR